MIKEQLGQKDKKTDDCKSHYIQEMTLIGCYVSRKEREEDPLTLRFA